MRKEKQLLLDEIKGQILGFDSSFILLRHSALKANVLGEFRREIAKNGGSLEMVRKRVFLKAAEAIGIKLDLDAMPGHIGVVFAGKDAVLTTKAVFKFCQTAQKNVEILGARFDGQMHDAATVAVFSALPDKDEMRAQLIATLVAAPAQTLAVLAALLTSPIYCLDNKCKESNLAI